MTTSKLKLLSNSFAPFPPTHDSYRTTGQGKEQFPEGTAWSFATALLFYFYCILYLNGICSMPKVKWINLTIRLMKLGENERIMDILKIIIIQK